MDSIIIFSPAVFQGYGHEFDYTTGLACALKADRTVEPHIVGFDGPFRPRLPDGLTAHTLKIHSVVTAKGSTIVRQVKWGLHRINQSGKLIDLALQLSESINVRGVLFESFEYYSLARRINRFKCPLRSVFHDTSFNAQQTSVPAAIYKSAMARSAAGIVARCERTFVHGEAMKENLVRSLRLDAQRGARVMPIPYGAPAPSAEDQVERSEARRAVGIPQDSSPLMLAFGTLRRDKEFPLLLKALSIASNWRLLIAGPEGDMTFCEINDLARRLGITDRIYCQNRFIPKAEQKVYFASADVIVGIYSPSIRHESGTCQLARAYLKPIIASGPPDLQNYVRDAGVGWCMPAHTAEALAQALSEVESTPEVQKTAMQKRIEACAAGRAWPYVCAQVFEGWY